MFTVEISKMVEFIHDNFKSKNPPRYENPFVIKDAIYICIPVSLEYKNKHVSTRVHLVLADYSYFILESNEYITREEEYKCISTHDSCWRSEIDRFFFKLYFKMAKQIDKKTPPSKMNSLSYLTFATARKVTIKYLPADSSCDYKLVDISEG